MKNPRRLEVIGGSWPGLPERCDSVAPYALLILFLFDFWGLAGRCECEARIFPGTLLSRNFFGSSAYSLALLSLYALSAFSFLVSSS